MNLIKAGAVLYANDCQSVADFYTVIAGFEVHHADNSYVHLETASFQLLVLEATQNSEQQPELEPQHNTVTRVLRRESSVIKLVFFVPSISEARDEIAKLGGELNSKNSERLYENYSVCDGVDPEGNIFQLCEFQAKSRILKFRT